MINQDRYVDIETEVISEYDPSINPYADDDANAILRITVDESFRITTDGKYRSVIE